MTCFPEDLAELQTRVEVLENLTARGWTVDSVAQLKAADVSLKCLWLVQNGIESRYLWTAGNYTGIISSDLNDFIVSDIVPVSQGVWLKRKDILTPGNSVSIMEFVSRGVLPTGVDLQEAIDYCVAQKKTLLLDAPSPITCAAPINVSGPVEIVGDAESEILFTATSGFIVSGNFVKFQNFAIKYAVSLNVTQNALIGIFATGNSFSLDRIVVTGFGLSVRANADKISLTSCALLDFNTGFDSTGSKQLDIADTQFTAHALGLYSITLISAAGKLFTDVLISNCSFSDFAGISQINFINAHEIPAVNSCELTIRDCVVGAINPLCDYGLQVGGVQAKSILLDSSEFHGQVQSILLTTGFANSTIQNCFVGVTGLSVNDTTNRLRYINNVGPVVSGEVSVSIVLGTKRVCSRSAPPIAGAWNLGDIVYNAVPSINQPQGWTCIQAGTPGVWNQFGFIGGISGSGMPLLKAAARLCPTEILANHSGIGQIIDGRAVEAGDRIFDPIYGDRKQRGLFIAQAGEWTRAAELDEGVEFSSFEIFIYDGGVNKGKEFRCMSNNVTLGVTDLEIYSVEGASQIGNWTYSSGTFDFVGDSNTWGRPGFYEALKNELVNPRGAWKNATVHGYAVSGMTASAIANKFLTGNRAQAPFNYFGVVGGAAWDGNPYQIINGKPDGIWFCQGINDLGTHVNRFFGYGTEENFRRNVSECITGFLMTNPQASICMAIPSPFTGPNNFDIPEASFSSGFELDLAFMPPGSTIVDAMARASAIIRKIYLEWADRHPRVFVVDTAKIFGLRIDNRDVDGQDKETPNQNVNLSDDNYHWSQTASARMIQFFKKIVGMPVRGYVKDYELATETLRETVEWGRMFWYRTKSPSGANTSISLHASVESVFTRGKFSSAMTGASVVAGHEALQQAEMANKLGLLGQLNELKKLPARVKLFFPETGNTYEASTMPFSSKVIDALAQGELVPEAYYTFIANTTNLVPEAAFGVVYVFVDQEDLDPRRRFDLIVPVSGTATGIGQIINPFKRLVRMRGAQFSRGDNLGGAMTVTMALANLSDGRFVEGAIVFGTAAGMEIGSVTIGSGIRVGTLALNTVNIDACLAAGIWTGFNTEFSLKPSYRIHVTTSMGLSGNASLMVRNSI